MPLCMPALVGRKELQKRIVLNDKVRVNNRLYKLHADLFFPEGLKAIKVDVVYVLIGNRAAVQLYIAGNGVES